MKTTLDIDKVLLRRVRTRVARGTTTLRAPERWTANRDCSRLPALTVRNPLIDRRSSTRDDAGLQRHGVHSRIT
jgi:hypothetical protein